MARAFAEIAFTPAVRAAQEKFGSADRYASFLSDGELSGNRLGPQEAAFISRIDGFYQATVGSNGWPYVQFRGGPRGFLKVVDAATIAYADFRGNRQYLSYGNLAGDDRISLILMDYANRQRLKILGRARAIDRADDPELVSALRDPAYRALPERAIVIAIEALDWNCPAHIPQRFTVEEIDGELARLRQEVARLKKENAAFKKGVE